MTARNPVGRVQRQIRRAFVASGGRPLLTIDLMRWAFPGVGHHELRHWQSVHRAAIRFATRLGRRGKYTLWAPHDALAQLIGGQRDKD